MARRYQKWSIWKPPLLNFHCSWNTPSFTWLETFALTTGIGKSGTKNETVLSSWVITSEVSNELSTVWSDLAESLDRNRLMKHRRWSEIYELEILSGNKILVAGLIRNIWSKWCIHIQVRCNGGRWFWNSFTSNINIFIVIMNLFMD